MTQVILLLKRNEKIRGEQNKIKAAKEKDKRLALRIQGTVKALTNGKYDFDHLQKESKKVKAEEIYPNCDLPPSPPPPGFMWILWSS